jgi:hypothetical protein
MNVGKLVFAQITQHLPLTTFRRCVARYGGAHKVKTFSCLDQYLCIAFAQLTYRESLRDIEACLRVQAGKLYHMGIKSRVSRSTLADANEVRDWRIYAEFSQSLIGIARRLYAGEPFGVDLKETVYALDASTIDLCLSVFPWAPFRSTKAAIKLHTALGPARQHSHVPAHQRRQASRRQCPRPVAARARRLLRHGPRLHRFRTTASPARGGQLLCDARQIESQSAASVFPSDRSKHGGTVRSDHRADRLLFAPRLRHAAAPHPIPRPCDRQAPGVPEQQLHSRCRRSPSPSFIEAGGRSRCFSNGIKQHLRIKRFFGTSENAVKTQIWIAVSVYVLVAIVKKRLNLSASLYEMLQILSLTMFERFPLDQLLNNSITDDIQALSANQLTLFD